MPITRQRVRDTAYRNGLGRLLAADWEGGRPPRKQIREMARLAAKVAFRKQRGMPVTTAEIQRAEVSKHV